MKHIKADIFLQLLKDSHPWITFYFTPTQANRDGYNSDTSPIVTHWQAM